jgi:hypothetical protein
VLWAASTISLRVTRGHARPSPRSAGSHRVHARPSDPSIAPLPAGGRLARNGCASRAFRVSRRRPGGARCPTKARLRREVRRSDPRWPALDRDAAVGCLYGPVPGRSFWTADVGIGESSSRLETPCAPAWFGQVRLVTRRSAIAAAVWAPHRSRHRGGARPTRSRGWRVRVVRTRSGRRARARRAAAR